MSQRIASNPVFIIRHYMNTTVFKLCASKSGKTHRRHRLPAVREEAVYDTAFRHARTAQEVRHGKPRHLGNLALLEAAVVMLPTNHLQQPLQIPRRVLPRNPYVK